MLFSSPVFFAFFAVYYAAQRLLMQSRWRIWLIVIGGAVFYAWWLPAYLPIPIVLTAVGYCGTLWVMARMPVSNARLVTAIVVLVLPLLVFKYTNFIAAQLGVTDRIVDLPLPLGISFITFTLIAYVVDVAKGRVPVERRFPMLAGYVLFFPHLIAGPILRPHELLPQLHRVRKLKVLPGIAIFSFGLFKKLVVADQIAAAIDPIFADPAAHSSLAAWLATYGFAVQIYCDFSGYTDMAIGLAILLGVKLPTNFRQPYAAASIVDFWRRWHITLSHWLRDYLYIPMGGNRRGRARRAAAVLATMTVGGLWHGANWTFVIWGVMHGVAVAAVQALGRKTIRLPKWLGIFLTFHFVALAWIFFRAKDLQTAMLLLGQLFAGGVNDAATFLVHNAFVILLIILALALHRLDDHGRIRAMMRNWPMPVILAVLFMLWLLAMTISAGSSAAFIYFDF